MTIQPWEAFGVSEHTTSPTVRVVFGDHKDWDPPPDAEVHQGVSSIRIIIYGDDPSSAFIHVHGLDERSVRAKWLNAQKVWSDPVIRDLIWTPR